MIKEELKTVSRDNFFKDFAAEGSKEIGQWLAGK